MNGRKILCKVIGSMVLAFTLALSGISIPDRENVEQRMNVTMIAQAASTRKCHLMGTSNVSVYGDTALSKRIGTIFPTDEITVITVTGKYSKVKYPISGNRTKTGYIGTGAILLSTGGSTRYVTKNMTTYQHYSGSPAYGTATVGDMVTVLGTYGNYTQIKYPVSFGYKYAFITTSDANAYLSITKNGIVNNNFNSGAYSISGNLLKVNGVSMTEYRLGSKYTSSRYANVNGKLVDMYGWQCCGYARYIQTKLYGYNDKSAPARFRNVAGTVSPGKLTAAKLKSAVQAAGVGAHFRTQGSNHSMAIIAVTDSGFTVTDANSDGRNTIRVISYTWSSYISSKYGGRGILYMMKYIG